MPGPTSVTAGEIKRHFANDLASQIEARGVALADLAKRMQTSRSQLDRLLDPEDPGLTLRSIARVARALGCEVRIELVPKG